MSLLLCPLGPLPTHCLRMLSLEETLSILVQIGKKTQLSHSGYEDKSSCVGRGSPAQRSATNSKDSWTLSLRHTSLYVGSTDRGALGRRRVAISSAASQSARRSQ